VLNKYTKTAIGAFLCASALTAIKHWKDIRDSEPDTICHLEFDSAVIANIPQATTIKQMARGLSNLKEVDNGMLFTWPDDDNRTFWMKDTYVPLSVAFIDSNGEVTQISDMSPNTEVHHVSLMPVREGLELPAGRFEQLGIGVGSKLVNRHCFKKGD